MPAPTAPWISPNEALTICTLMIAMKVPIVEPTTAVQVFRGTAGVMAARRPSMPRPGVDGRLDRHAGAQAAGERLFIEHALHRHALPALGEVAGGVVGRQQREFKSARRRHAVDMALERDAGEGIDLDLDRLARAHTGKLGR